MIGVLESEWPTLGATRNETRGERAMAGAFVGGVNAEVGRGPTRRGEIVRLPSIQKTP